MRIAMRLAMMTAVMTAGAMAGVVDRVAVVVGTDVITESEVLREVRLTALMNGSPLDLGLEQRRAAAERLVDQQLIRKEMEIGNYPPPTAQEGDALLGKFRQEHYPGDAQFRSALEKYGINEQELRQHLLWQLAAIRFTDQRFHVLTASTQLADHQSADRSTANEASVDDQMDAWLKQQRGTTRIQFKKGAFGQ